MKKISIFLVVILVLAGCSNRASNKTINTDRLTNENVTITNSAVSSNTIIEKTSVNTKDNVNTDESKNTALSNIDNYVGIYCYDYEDDTPDLIEDHYIVLENVKGQISGRYYGTSDDFDQAREGYYPGFFVADMKNLMIRNNEISFEIYLTEDDMFSKPVNLKYKYSKGVPIDENPLWQNNHIIEVSDNNPRKYKGKIVNGEITLNIDEAIRFFNKINSENIIIHEDNHKIEPFKNNNSLVVNNYKKYLESLNVDNISSISLAVNKYKTIISDTKSINDDLYRLFCDFTMDYLINLIQGRKII